MKGIVLASCLSLGVWLTSCDDGRIYEQEIVIPQEGLTLKMTGNISNIASWPNGYSIVVAGFNDDSEYAVVSKIVPNPETDGGEVTVEMSSIRSNICLMRFG